MQQPSCRIAPKQRETHLELPPPDAKRWSSRRKAAVVVATRTGILSRMEACQRYMLSDEELADWEGPSIGAAFKASSALLSTSTETHRNRPTSLLRSARARIVEDHRSCRYTSDWNRHRQWSVNNRGSETKSLARMEMTNTSIDKASQTRQKREKAAIDHLADKLYEDNAGGRARPKSYYRQWPAGRGAGPQGMGS
jgi:hypothetical protein